MFHSRNTNNKVNKLQESALRLVYNNEFVKSHAMRTMRISVVYVPTWQRGNMPKACHIFIFTCQRTNAQKVWQFFNLACQHAKDVLIFQKKIFFNFSVFKLWLTFANFKNIWAILEYLSRETKNLNFETCLFLFTCYKSCFSYLSCTP